MLSYVSYELSMSNAPNTIPDLIDRWPTIGEFARSIGCEYEAARQMRLRSSIAPEHWPRVIKASKKQGVTGVTNDWLIAQRTAKKPRFTQSQQMEA